VIEFDHVNFRFGQRTVLEDITLTLSQQRIGIIGLNGSGKSTLARLCNGLLIPSEGSVCVHGYDTRKDLPAVRAQVGFVFQDPDLQIIMPTVGEDMAFSLRGRKLPKDEQNSLVDQWLSDYGLADHRDHPAHLLSGGQKQLLAIAAILITEPKIVIFDEPTTLLDLLNRTRVLDVIASLTQQVLVVTHDLDAVGDFDRVIILNEGKVVADDVPSKSVKAYRQLVLG